jgi:urease accessory protein UreE
MAKTALQKVQEVLEAAELTYKELYADAKKKIARVTLENGREVAVNLVDGWQDALVKNVRKFSKKGAVGSKTGDKA